MPQKVKEWLVQLSHRKWRLTWTMYGDGNVMES